MTALLERGGYHDVEFYDGLLDMYPDSDPTKLEQIKSDREAAILHTSELEVWNEKYDEYIDQFQAEICLKLRRGELQAMGTQLPDVDPEQTDKILEQNKQ